MAWLLALSGGFRSDPGCRTPDCGPAPELNNFHSWPTGYHLTDKAA